MDVVAQSTEDFLEDLEKLNPKEQNIVEKHLDRYLPLLSENNSLIYINPAMIEGTYVQAA